MSYNILGVNPSHNGSVCLLSDGELILYLEEERLTKKKYDELPLKSILYILDKYSVDDIALAGINLVKTPSSFFKEPVENLIFRKLGFNSENFHDFSADHHVSHISSAFYNSEFDKAVGIVVDAGGSLFGNEMVEMDTIFVCSYPSNFQTLYKNYNDFSIPLENEGMGVGRSFGRLCETLGFSSLDGGKIMGLSSYGKQNPKIPNLFYGNKTNPKYANVKKFFNDFFPQNYSKEWHHNPNNIIDLEKDISWKLQSESQTILGDYIREAIKITNLNKVVISGGFGLNCVSNYYLKKRFPKVEFYFDPIAHDGGTAIGVAKLLYHQKTQDKMKRSQKTLYYGPKYTKKQLLKGIKKYLG